MIEMQRATMDVRARAIAARDEVALERTYADGASLDIVDWDTFPRKTGRAHALLGLAYGYIWTPDPSASIASGRAWAKDDMCANEWLLRKGDSQHVIALSILRFDPNGGVAEESLFIEPPRLWLTPWPEVDAALVPLDVRVPQSASEDSEVEVAKRLYAAIEGNDEPSLATLLAPGFRLTSPFSDGPAHGSLLRQLRRALPDVSFSIQGAWAVGDDVLVDYVMSGTQSGELLGHKATGRRVHLRAVDVMRITGGRVERIETHSNASALRRQMELDTKTDEGRACRNDATCSSGLACDHTCNQDGCFGGPPPGYGVCRPPGGAPPWSADELFALARARTAQLRETCRARRPDGPGEPHIRVRIVIAPSGDVDSSEVSGDTADVNRCVERSVARWKLRRSFGGVTATLPFPPPLTRP
jgi:ketosteroid isomerase-like protein